MPTWVNFNTHINSIDWSKFTHVNISFGNPNAYGIIDEGYSISQMETLVTKVHDNGGRVLISIGGANAPDYTNYLKDENRFDFVHQWVEYIECYNLDGIDVDLEGSRVPEKYTEFVQDLAAALKPKGKLVTAALGTWFSNRISDEALAEFDWVNIMAYDETGSWAPERPGQHSSYKKAESDLKHWKSRGLSKDQIVLGVPFYGYDFDNNGIGVKYKDIISNNTNAENLDQIGQLYYNGQPTIAAKTELAIEKGNGIMIWEITQDLDVTDSRSLLRTINETIKKNINVPLVSFNSPSNHSINLINTTITLSANASDAQKAISDVSFYANGTLLYKDQTAPYTYDWTPNSADEYTISAIATNADAVTSFSELAISIRDPQGPYSDTLHIPGLIKAENYDLGGADTAFYDQEKKNQGNFYRDGGVDLGLTFDGGENSYYIGWIETGEWIEYTVNIDSTSIYRLDTRVASLTSSGKFYLELNGEDITGIIPVISTGGLNTWETINTHDIELTKGKYVLRFVVTRGGFNLNSFSFFHEGEDCNGDLDGTAELDACGVCSGGETGLTPSTNELDCVIGINNKQKYTFEVYPNPSSNYIHIESEHAISEWVLSDPLGTTILKGNSVDINIEPLTDGIYILMVDGKSKKIEKY